MKTTKFLSKVMLVAFTVIVSLQSIGQQLPDYVGKSNKVANFDTGKSGPILFDQISDPGNGWMLSQHYSTITNNENTCAVADDFDVPEGESWDVHSIAVLGAYWQGAAGGGDTLNLYIMNDDNGMPGDTIQGYFELTDFLNIEEVVGDYISTYFEITLPSLVTLTEGTYWVSVQLYSDYNATGQWGWLEHNVGTTVYGAEWHWINPKDGFGYGFTTWTPANIVVGPWVQWEMSFALYGEPLSNDLAAVSITSPEDYFYGPPTEEQDVAVIIKNEGSTPQTDFDLTYNINGTEVTENIGSVTLEYNETYEYTFAQTVDLSTPGMYDLSVSVFAAGDENPDNDEQNMEIIVFDPTVYTMPSLSTSYDSTCSGTFADAGGIDGDLTVDDWGIYTIYPTTPGSKIRLDFIQFDIDWSDFWIYDGEDIYATELGYWENDQNPGTITASYQNTSGALTIQFIAQGWTPFEASGWAANIQCYDPPEDDFEVMKIELSHPAVFEYDYVTAYASIKNNGTTIIDKDVTFTANGVVFATAPTGPVTQSDTVVVEVIWNPDTEGDYELTATVPDDMGPYDDNSSSMMQHVYPFDHFYEGFELPLFPPDGWSQSGTAWTHHDYSPAIGNGHAYCWVEYGLFDTLYTPRLHIESGDIISFYSYSSAWWPGELDLCWIDGETGVASLIEAVAIPWLNYQYFEIDVSAAAGDNYLGFVGKYNPMGGQGELKLDEVIGIGIEKFFYEDDLKAYILSGDITPEENIATTLEIEIKNIGSEFQSGSEYTVKLMQDADTELMSYPGQDINPKEVLNFTLDYTFPNAGLYSCYIEVDFADDMDLSNNISSPLNVYVQQEGTVQVYIGENNDYSSNWWHPITISTTGFYTQTLFLAEEVGDPNTITGIMYYYLLDENYPIYDVPVTIWLSETDAVNMEDSLEAANNYDLVFEGTFDAYPGYHGVYLPLDFVYSYQGGNLMVTTYKDYDSGQWASFYVGTTHTNDTMVRYYNGYENNAPIDPYVQQTLDSVYLHKKPEYGNIKFFKFNLEGQYCTPVVLNGTTAGDYIDGVTFNDIENLGTGSQGGPAYNNYTSFSTNVERGRTYELTIQAETSGTIGSIAAWIDFNGNNELDDEGERIVHISSDEASQEITVQVTIPDDATIGLTILRVRNSAEADLFASCEAVDYGETEDYGINIIETIQVYSPVLDFNTELTDNIVDMNWNVPENPGIAHIEGFEMSTWPPQGGWEVKQSTSLGGTLVDPTGDTWNQYNEDMQFVYNGAFSALSPASAIDFNWLITPEVQLYGNDELSFMLNYSSDGSGYSRFYVLVEVDGDWTTVLEYTEEITMYNNFEESVTVDLTEFAGKLVRVAFVTEYNDAYPIAIDDAILRGVEASGKSVSGITGYDIYRNGELLTSIDDPSIVEFTDELTETENYTYCIYAMYDDGEKSEEACSEEFYLAPLTAPINVLAAAIDNDVTVSWVAPNAGMQRFSDDFENYTVNQQVACQNPDVWTTWTLDPCGDNDPYISSEQAYNGEKSVVNEGMSDLLYINDEMLEEGKFSFNFRLYIPEGYNGYFNVLQDHDLTIGSLWGMQAFFDENGIATLDGGGYGSATFSYEYDKWMYIELIVDMDSDWSEFLVEGELVHEWQWSTGIGGGAGWNTFEGVDFYSWNTNGPAKFFVDDVHLTQLYDATELLEFNIYKDGSLYGNATGNMFEDNDVSPGIHDYCVSAVYDEGESEQVCDFVLILTAPQNFTAIVENTDDVVCSWDEIVSSDLTGYNLFKNGNLLEANITGTEWTDEDVDGGTHTYFSTAVYEGGESIPSDTAEVVLILAPTNLEANVDGDNIILDWDAVGEVSTGELIELYQHDETPANGLYQWFDFGYGVIYDLSGYTETTIEMVDFHHSSYGITGTWSYLIHIVDWSTFTEIAEIGPFQTTGNDIWELEIPLESVVPTGNLIGIFLEPMSNEPQDAYPILACDAVLDGTSFEASLDDLTANNPAPGDFLMDLWIMAESGKELVKAKKFEVNNLELINVREPYIPVLGEITLKQKGNGPKSLLGYNVYYSFNSEPFSVITTATDTTYTHEGAAVEGLHTYYVTATYDEGESDPSNEATILLSGVDEIGLDEMNVFPNPVNDILNIRADYSISRILVVNSKGQIVRDEQSLTSGTHRINISDIPSGIYNIRIETTKGWINRKVVKK